MDGHPLMSFEQVIEQYHDEIFRYLWQLMCSPNALDSALEVQDVTQDVFLRAYQAFARLRPESNYRAWLYKIATNTAYSALKSRKRLVGQLDIDEQAEAILVEQEKSPIQQMVLGETLLALQSAVDCLPIKQRAALVMRYLHELTYSEVAEALNCSEDSARANVYQATRRLRQEFKQKGIEAQEVLYE